MKGYIRIRFLNPFGARVHIHWSALLVMACILAASFRNPFLATVSLSSYFGMLFLHEAGHAYFATRLGYRAFDIYINFVHGCCVYEKPHDKKHESIVAWGGVFAQLLFAVPIILVSQTAVAEHILGYGPVAVFLGYFSAAIAFINLAPSRGLDGAKAWGLVPIVWAERRKKPGKSGNVVKGPWDRP